MVQLLCTTLVVASFINMIRFDSIIKAALIQTIIPQNMMGFDLWKVLQMHYHVLGIGQSPSNLHTDLQQPGLHCTTALKEKSAATDAAMVIHSYFDAFN